MVVAADAASFIKKGRGWRRGLCRRVVFASAQGAGRKVLRIDRPAAGGFLSLTAFQAEGCGLPLCGNAYKVSVMREGS